MMEQTTVQCSLQSSDWVLIFTSLFLGLCALFVPYLAALIKRKLFAPSLRIEYLHIPPHSRLTRRENGSSVYYFNPKVANNGKSQAIYCEIIVEEIYISDSAGNFIKEENFIPVNLVWSGKSNHQFVNINPGKDQFFNIGHISAPEYQREVERSIYQPEQANKNLKFFFEFSVRSFAQRDCISPGKVKIKVVVYSENATKCEKWFQISWSGNWQDREQDMFREIVIS